MGSTMLGSILVPILASILAMGSKGSIRAMGSRVAMEATTMGEIGMGKADEMDYSSCAL